MSLLLWSSSIRTWSKYWIKFLFDYWHASSDSWTINLDILFIGRFDHYNHSQLFCWTFEQNTNEWRPIFLCLYLLWWMSWMDVIIFWLTLIELTYWYLSNMDYLQLLMQYALCGYYNSSWGPSILPSQKAYFLLMSCIHTSKSILWLPFLFSVWWWSIFLAFELHLK